VLDGGTDGPIRNPPPRRVTALRTEGGGSLRFGATSDKGDHNAPVLRQTRKRAFRSRSRRRRQGEKLPHARPLRACLPSIGVDVLIPESRTRNARPARNACKKTRCEDFAVQGVYRAPLTARRRKSGCVVRKNRMRHVDSAGRFFVGRASSHDSLWASGDARPTKRHARSGRAG